MDALEALAATPQLNRWYFDQLAPTLRGDVLEVGAGIGNMSALIAPACDSLCVTDMDEAHVAALEKRFAARRNVEAIQFELGKAMPDSAGIGDPLTPYVEVQWDYAERSGDSFRVYTGDAPRAAWVGGIRAQGQIEAGQLNAYPLPGRRAVGVTESWGPGVPVVDIVMYDLHLTRVALSSGWSCVGSRESLGWQPGGELYGFVTVEDMDETLAYVSSGDAFERACARIAGLPGALDRCADTPRGSWTTLPTALCLPEGCTDRECDPRVDCNAFRVPARFAAYAIAE